GYPLTMKQLRQHPEGIDLGPLKPSLLNLLGKRQKRIKLLPSAITRDLHDLRARVADSNLPADVAADTAVQDQPSTELKLI
ncbi:hypothetical protein NL337_26865, partial [Klebsiella pneumoniae]|nr:hypothetical protein [Klebsiella pneumoniae]